MEFYTDSIRQYLLCVHDCCDFITCQAKTLWPPNEPNPAKAFSKSTFAIKWSTWCNVSLKHTYEDCPDPGVQPWLVVHTNCHWPEGPSLKRLQPNQLHEQAVKIPSLSISQTSTCFANRFHCYKITLLPYLWPSEWVVIMFWVLVHHCIKGYIVFLFI